MGIILSDVQTKSLTVSRKNKKIINSLQILYEGEEQ